MVTVSSKTLERQLLLSGHKNIIGVDEVGMACLAGPVVVCALAATAAFYDHSYPKLTGLRDSKALSARQREYFAEALTHVPGLTWRIVQREPAEIDSLNIYQASRVAMRQAVHDLCLTDNSIVLVDGNKLISEVSLPQRAIVGGDRKIWAIAAASILAKVYRDQLMIDYAQQYPGYGLEQHKGYPTAAHYQALTMRGPTLIHRRSFRLTKKEF